MTLFFKESRKVIFSLTFLIYIFAVAGFYFTQFVPDSTGAVEAPYGTIEPPSGNQEFYGTAAKEVHEIPMASVAEPLTAEYNDIFENDQITGAYARLFCDYIGIIVSIMPVFVAVSLVNADRKSRNEQVVYARKISSARLILTRFSALSVMMIIPVMIFSGIATIQVKSIYPNYDIGLSAIPLMSIYWLVPNILFSTALGMFVTELISPLIAIFLQGVMWVASLMGGAANLTGAIGRFTLVCRHNSLYERHLFMENLDKFIFNRIFYTLAAVLCIVFTVCIYNLKRRGDFYVIGKRPENSAGQSET